MADNLSATLSLNLKCAPKDLAARLVHPIDRHSAEKPFIGVSMELTYDEAKTIDFGGLSEKSALKQMAYNKHHLKVSVAQHYFVKHGIDLKWPDQPCVVVSRATRAGGLHEDFYPLELVRMQSAIEEPKQPVSFNFFKDFPNFYRP